VPGLQVFLRRLPGRAQGRAGIPIGALLGLQYEAAALVEVDEVAGIRNARYGLFKYVGVGLFIVGLGLRPLHLQDVAQLVKERVRVGTLGATAGLPLGPWHERGLSPRHFSRGRKRAAFLFSAPKWASAFSELGVCDTGSSPGMTAKTAGSKPCITARINRRNFDDTEFARCHPGTSAGVALRRHFRRFAIIW
jgi:hypothetical protein